jgi:cardiolipin synthase (CMP-forming)
MNRMFYFNRLKYRSISFINENCKAASAQQTGLDISYHPKLNTKQTRCSFLQSQQQIHFVHKSSTHYLNFKSTNVLRVLLSLSAASRSKPAAHIERIQASNFANRSSQSEQYEDKNIVVTVPNMLTALRILLTPLINYYVIVGHYELACGLFVTAGLTDLLDGYIARNFANQKSYLGSIIDPFADKFLIGTLTVTLALSHMIPWQLALVIIGRDVLLIASSLYVRYKHIRREHELLGLLDSSSFLCKYVNVKKYANVKIEADLISKLNTFLQIALIAFTLPSNLFDYNNSVYLLYMQYATGLTTIASAASYLYKGGSYKLIDKKKQQ